MNARDSPCPIHQNANVDLENANVDLALKTCLAG